MIKKKYYTNSNIKSFILEIIGQMFIDKFRPDYIVGLVRGGVTPATMISHYLNIPCYTLDVRLRDHNGKLESNVGMAQDAYGEYDGTSVEGKNILIVDDINDSGTTLNWIKKDWQDSYNPFHADQGSTFVNTRWDDVWSNSVKVAVLTENLASNFEGVDYYADVVNKMDDDVWLVYPWEEWWSDKTE